MVMYEIWSIGEKPFSDLTNAIVSIKKITCDVNVIICECHVMVM